MTERGTSPGATGKEGIFCPLRVKEASGWYTEQERSAADEGMRKDSVVSRTGENTKKSTNLISRAGK